MKLPFALFTFVLIVSEGIFQKIDDDILTAVKLIEKNGYPVEVHTVETKDGYLLEMHRIPYGIKNDSGSGAKNRRKFPVIYSNGLFGSSAELLLQPSNKSLAFLLANLGFDVWLGNFRGNRYSRANTHLSPDSKEFWDFSWHESGVYDLPAMIDYVLQETGAEKVILVGFSMGTTSFFVMTSMIPEYNDKVEMGLLMAPIAYVKHLSSPLIRAILPFKKIIEFADELVGNGELPPNGKLLRAFSRFFCIMNRVEKRLCESVIFLIIGVDYKQFDEGKMKLLLKVYPDSYSVKGPFHYGQLVESGEFRQYDHGKMENMVHYGSPTPPNYNVSAITTDMVFYVGKNDYLSTIPDVKRLAKQLPTLKKLRVIDYFNHLDYVVAENAKELLYNYMIEDLLAHLNALEITE